ncbi:MAG: hypothetical protein ACPGWR_15440, partial [Ardenticatenaceae bacterium]
FALLCTLRVGIRLRWTGARLGLDRRLEQPQGVMAERIVKARPRSKAGRTSRDACSTACDLTMLRGAGFTSYGATSQRRRAGR